MWEEFLYSMEIQGLISMFGLIIGLIFFNQMSVSSLTIEVFPYLVLGLYLLYFSFLGGTLMQYFENYEDSMRVFSLGLFLNFIFGVLTLKMGRDYYGLGMIFSSLITFSYTIIKLRETLEELDFKIFTTGSLRSTIKKGWLDKVLDIINDRK